MTSANDPEKKPSQPPRPEHAAAESQETSEQTPLAKVDVLHTFIEEYKARDDQNSCLQKRNFWLGVITAVIVFAYTTVAALQWCAAREANQIAWDALTYARETAKLEQRAWVGIGEVTVLGELTAGKPLGATAAIGNSGESPAVHAFVYGELSFLKSRAGDNRIPLSWNAEYAHCKGDKPRWDDVVGGTIILPGANTRSLNRVSAAVPKEYIEMIRKEKLNGSLSLSQGQSQELQKVPIAPDTPLNVQQQIGLFFVGCVNYFDVFREAHRTTFCFEYAYSPELAATFPKGAFNFCGRGNDAD